MRLPTQMIWLTFVMLIFGWNAMCTDVRSRKSRYTIEELQVMKFPNKISDDIDLDVCKSDGFIGDIALPNRNYEKEYIQLKKEVSEGLQVEEEGLTDFMRIKLKQSATVPPPAQINEPNEWFDSSTNLKNNYGIQSEIKNTMLKENLNDSSTNFEKSQIENNSSNYDINYKTEVKRNEIRYKQIDNTSNVENGTQLFDFLIKLTNYNRNSSTIINKKKVDSEISSHTMSGKKLRKDVISNIEEEFPYSEYVTDVPDNKSKRYRRKKRRYKKKKSKQTVITTDSEKTSGESEGDGTNQRNKRELSRRRKSISILISAPSTVSVPRGRSTRAATARKERVWDHGVIPYEIDGNFSGAHKALFKQAMKHWENFTCIKFVERVPDEHSNYIIFTERPCGCCSFVGKRGNGAQAISIGKNCDKFGIVVHELGHVVGFWHEHTRPDRDHHVQIFRDNIMNGQEYNFNKLTEEEVNSLGLPYDYDSIMHYARNTFSKGTYLDTIAPQEKQIRGKKVPEIGQRLRLSQGDIAQTNLLYKCAKCGRTFQENTAIFSSPSYLNPSNSDPERCEWRITATHGERIILNITDLDIHKSPNCSTDYIEIRDGYWHKSTYLGRFCGSGRLNEPIVSNGSRMLVTYVASSKQLGRRGFTASYESVCGGILNFTSSSGTLESPNYPDDYMRNKECVWKLIVPPTYTVALKFQSFEIENHDSCVYDYVEIIDGFEPDSLTIGKFCGYKAPPDIRSSSNKLLVKFFSDASVQKAGFSATFMKEHNECDQIDHGCEHYCINTVGSYECACKIGFELHSDGKSCEAACGGIYDSPNGTITSPSFPDTYPPNKRCIWEIIAPPKYRITLNFTHFDLEGNNLHHQECEYDNVIVKSKLGEDVHKKHGTFCGNLLPNMVTSEGNALRVEFNSDFTIHKSGFAAIFFTDMDECAIDNGGCQHECSNTIGSYRCTCHNGFMLHENKHDCKEGGCKYEVTAPFGEIESPNYPDYYPSRKDCVWHFVTTPGHRIKLVFEKFEMEPHQECAYDHIVLYDGDSSESRILGRYCGSKLPHPILATSNQMLMVFKSDASVQRKGFKAMHSTACGGHLIATDTVKHLYSHSRYGDYNYGNRADCDWTIETTGGKSVHLTFLTFELEDEVNCGYDYVELHSGLDASGQNYGKFCGNQNPPDIITNGDALLIRFRSDDTIVSKGFSASYVAEEQYDEEFGEEPTINSFELNHSDEDAS